MKSTIEAGGRSGDGPHAEFEAEAELIYVWRESSTSR